MRDNRPENSPSTGSTPSWAPPIAVGFSIRRRPCRSVWPNWPQRPMPTVVGLLVSQRIRRPPHLDRKLRPPPRVSDRRHRDHPHRRTAEDSTRHTAEPGRRLPFPLLEVGRIGLARLLPGNAGRLRRPGRTHRHRTRGLPPLHLSQGRRGAHYLRHRPSAGRECEGGGHIRQLRPPGTCR